MVRRIQPVARRRTAADAQCSHLRRIARRDGAIVVTLEDLRRLWRAFVANVRRRLDDWRERRAIDRGEKKFEVVERFRERGIF